MADHLAALRLATCLSSTRTPSPRLLPCPPPSLQAAGGFKPAYGAAAAPAAGAVADQLAGLRLAQEAARSARRALWQYGDADSDDEDRRFPRMGAGGGGRGPAKK